MSIRLLVAMDSWTPENGVFNNQGLVKALNTCPLGGNSLVGTPGLSADLTLTANEVVLGAGCHPETTKVFYGTAAKLYSIESGAATDRSGAAYTAEAVPYAWNFLPFGLDIIACGGVNQRPQYRDAAAGANFADLLDATSLANNDIKPRYITAIGQRVMVGCLNNTTTGTSHPDRVWWSATNNARRFGTAATDPTLRTGYQDLPDDHGHIQGLVGAADHAYVFKNRAIYRMEMSGPYGFSFRPIAIGTGTASPRSIVPVDGDVYFWTTSGPAVIREGGIVEALVSRDQSRILMADLADYVGLNFDTHSPSLKREIAGWYCPFTRTVNWSYLRLYDLSGASGVFANISYQVDSHRWSHQELTASIGGASLGVSGIHVATQSQGANLSGHRFGRLARVIMGNGASSISNTYKLYTFTGAGRDVVLETGMLVMSELLGISKTPASIVRARPVFRHNITDLTGTKLTLVASGYNSLMLPRAVAATETVTADLNGVDDQGFITLNTGYHTAFTLKLTIAGSTSASTTLIELVGLELEIAPGGAR